MTTQRLSLPLVIAGFCGACAELAAPPSYEVLAAQVRALPIVHARPAEHENLFGAPPREHLTASFCLHALRLCGLELELRMPDGSEVRALDLVTSATLSERHMGGPTLIRSRTGLRFPTFDPRFAGPGDESHRGLGLAGLGALGLSLDHPLEFEGSAHTLRDVLRDTLAEFDLRQRELEWTAEALARWLPPHSTWTNRLGLECSLDALAMELLARPLAAASCGGSHLLLALTTLLQAQRREPFLRPAVATSIEARLSDAREVALHGQAEDGSWNHAWVAPLLSAEEQGRIHPEHSRVDRVLMTGHLAEWLARCDPDDVATRSALVKAGHWLHAELLATPRATAWDNYCPYSHAVHVARTFGPGTALRLFEDPAEPVGSAVLPASPSEAHTH